MSNRTLWENFKKNLALLNKDNFTEFQEIVKYIIQNINPDEVRNEELKYLNYFIREFEIFFINWSSDWEEFVKSYKDTERFEIFINNGNHLFEVQEIKVRIQGFTCIFLDAKDDQIDRAIAKIEKTLQRINRIAKEHFPLLLNHKVPLYFSFEKPTFCLKPVQTHTTVSFLVDGCYLPNRKVIEIIYFEKMDTKLMSGLIGHELGHHIFRNYLSDKAKQFWEDVINGVTENLTIRQVFGESDDYFKEVSQIYWTAPTLTNYQDLSEKQLFFKKLQLDLDIDVHQMTEDQIRFIISQNLDTPIRIHKRPMTVYANTNPEEAFCEFLRVLFHEDLFMIDRSWRKYFETTMGTRIQNKLANSLFMRKTILQSPLFKKGRY